MKIIPPWKVWSMRQLALSSVTFGVYLSVPLLCLLPLALTGPFSPPVAGMILLLVYFGVFLIALPCYVLHRCRFHLSTAGRRIAAVLWTLLGVSLVHYGIILAATLLTTAELFSWTLPMVHAIVGGLWLTAAPPAYMVIRHFAPFKVQDGSTCPGCGHCVRGVWSQVCPECGRDFDHSNLGLSITEFDQRYGPGTRAIDHEGAR